MTENQDPPRAGFLLAGAGLKGTKRRADGYMAAN
jgi:hypothetical protein